MYVCICYVSEESQREGGATASRALNALAERLSCKRLNVFLLVSFQEVN